MKTKLYLPIISLLAMSVLTMIPVLIIFLIFQKQFMKGMVAGAVKG